MTRYGMYTVYDYVCQTLCLLMLGKALGTFDPTARLPGHGMSPLAQLECCSENTCTV